MIVCWTFRVFVCYFLLLLTSVFTGVSEWKHRDFVFCKMLRPGILLWFLLEVMLSVGCMLDSEKADRVMEM